VVGALAVWARVGPAAAADVSVVAPRACAIGDELSFRAEQALGQPLKSAANVRCSIHIAHAPGVYAARLELDWPGSSRPSRLRAFRAPTCAKLADLLALAVVLAVGGEEDAEGSDPAGASPLDPDSMGEAKNGRASVALAPTPGGLEGAAGAAAGVATDAPAPDVDAAPTTVVRGEGRSRAPHLGAHAALVADAGTLPRVGFGPRLGASLGWNVLELRASATYLLPRDVSIERPNASPAGAEVGLFAGALDVCAPRLLALSSVEAGVCADAELGWLWGSSSDVSGPEERGTVWSAAGADVVGRWALAPRMGLDLSIGARVPFERDEFAIGGLGSVHQPGRVIGRVGVGVSVDFDGTPGTGR
jgi:hypothetical protein